MKNSDVKQLLRIIEKVRAFELQREDVSGALQVRGFIVSNAQGMSEEAWDLAEQHGVVFLRIKTSKECGRTRDGMPQITTWS